MLMQLNRATGWMSDARIVESPNHDARPDNTVVDALVVHAISLPPNEFGGPYIEQLFCNCLDPEEHAYFKEICHLNVSAHFLVRRDGELIQFVPTQCRAWHAGQSELQGRTAANDFSIGIELEGCDTAPFTEIQYQQLASLTNALRQAYPAITAERIVGHSDIAPGRKTDPGPYFEWDTYFSLIAD